MFFQLQRKKKNTADYFPVQSCSWAVGQHCTGKQFSRATLTQADRDNIIQVIFLQKHFCASWANIIQVFCFVPCCLRHIWTTLTRQYSYAMLSQYDRYSIVQVIFFIKVVCQPWTNITQVNTLRNVVQEAPDNNAQEKILLNVVLILSGQHCTGQDPMQ